MSSDGGEDSESVRAMTARLPAGLHEWLRREAFERHVSVNSLLIEAAENLHGGREALGQECSVPQPALRPSRLPAERRHISFGNAGTVTITVDTRCFLDLPEDQLLRLREIIKDIEALGGAS